MHAKPPEKPVVHLIDDDESFRTGVDRLLRAVGYDVRTYPSAGDFALMRQADLSGCVLLDVRMPGPSGLDLLASLKRNGDTLPVIFLTGHGDIPMSVRAIKEGASDFLTKPVQRQDLLAAVAAALAKESEARAERDRLRALQNRRASLTRCEGAVFERVVAGLPNKQIARELNTGERTVKAHRAHVMEKMQASSLAELVRIAASCGMNCEDRKS
jgi:FixJ family two-component response regulator